MNSKKIILVLDGQGGGMGTQLIKMLAPVLPADCELVAVGTNVLATNAMLKAGAPAAPPAKTPWCTMLPGPTSSWAPSA